jgi:hypothetical protein
LACFYQVWLGAGAGGQGGQRFTHARPRSSNAL